MEVASATGAQVFQVRTEPVFKFIDWAQPTRRIFGRLPGEPVVHKTRQIADELIKKIADKGKFS